MKITVCSYYLPPRDRIGSGVQMHMLANAYVDLGHEVTVLSPSFDCSPEAKYQLESISLQGRNRTFQWARFLSKYKFDCDFVHFNGDDFLVPVTSDYVHVRTFMGSCLAEAKVASSFRDRLRMTYLGLGEIASSVKFPLSTVISNDTNRYLPRKGVWIPCGVDLETFIPGHDRHHSPTILFVGTLDSRKRGRQLLDQFNGYVKVRIPDAELWIVREAEQIRLPGVSVFGSVSQEKLVDLYQRAWVFCLPSSYEGFGVPYVEAMACGTPVVASHNPGALEVLEGGKFGVVSEIHQLGDSLCTLLGDRNRREELSRLGLARSRQFDIRKVAEEYISLASNRLK